MMSSQQCLFNANELEDNDYLRQQLITYIGNKRALLSFIENGLNFVKSQLRKEKVSFLDLFSGSGVVSRMARQHSTVIHCNDLEIYSETTNRCYQSNAADIAWDELSAELRKVETTIKADGEPGFITELYAPRDENHIFPGERVFYTRRNATYLDAFSRALFATPDHLRPYLLAPILSQASMHVNTSGVFKGFYKNSDGVGQYGGSLQNALTRIRRDIYVALPILSRMRCDSLVHREDANDLVRNLEAVDIAYFDPPYNQHPYGSNYFMLNLLCHYRKPTNISSVSGIPVDWNRSLYNKAPRAADVLFDAIAVVKAKFVLISYNSEGFIDRKRFLSELSRLGRVSVMDTLYNTFRGCRNLSDRNSHVTEQLFLLDKR